MSHATHRFHRTLIAGLVAGALLATAGAAFAGSVGPLPDEQLAALENAKVYQGTPLPWNKLASRFPHYAYFQVFQQQYSSAKETAKIAAKLDAATPADRPVQLASLSNVPGTLNGYDKGADAASGLSVALSPLKGSMVAGTAANSASNALTTVALAFDILSFMSRDTTEADWRRKTISALKSPSLYLMKSSTAVKSDADIYGEIVNGQRLMASFGLQCDPARWHDDRALAVGQHITGNLHSRSYVC